MLIETNYIWGSQFLLIRPAIGNLMFLQIVSPIKSFCNIYGPYGTHKDTRIFKCEKKPNKFYLMCKSSQP